MAHNSKRNRRDTTTQDGDEYVYPTAKVRETKTRDRRSSRNLIKKGLIDLENSDHDEEMNELINDDEWHDDTPEASEDDIEAFYDKVEEQKRIENEEGGFSDAVFEFNAVNTNWDHRWEDY